MNYAEDEGYDEYDFLDESDVSKHKHKWIGLTDEEIDKLRGYQISRNLGEIRWVRTIEQAIKDKNT
jgi:hypothetical protein